jgi:hypothetical protein
MALLEPLRSVVADNVARQREIAVCETVGLLIRSTCNILRFYRLREDLAWNTVLVDRLKALGQMQQLVVDEVAVTSRLLTLAEADTRLGFQADSECHVYYPTKLRWRIDVLNRLTADEFMPVERALRSGQDPFAAYTGRAPEGSVLRCRRSTGHVAMDGRVTGDVWGSCEPVALDSCVPAGAESATPRATSLRACWNEEALYLALVCAEPDMGRLRTAAHDTEPVAPDANDCVQISIEPQRLWPARRIFVTASGARYHITAEAEPDYAWTAASFRGPNSWSLTIRLPWRWLLPDGSFTGRPIRLNVQRYVPLTAEGGRAPNLLRLGWPCVLTHLPHRLMLSSENPADLGWCLPQGAD